MDTCRFHPSVLLGSLVCLLSVALGRSAEAQLQQQDCLLPVNRNWSSPSTWPSGVVPGLGDSVTIPANKIVVLDVSPPPLTDVTVLGKLLWASKNGLVLEAGSFHVLNGGELRIGCESTPFNKNSATIRLSAPSCANPAASGLFVEDGGRLELWGKHMGPSWTELATTASAGQPGLVLTGNVAWPAGAQVAVASSDFDCEYFDLGTILSASGANVTLTANLTREHFAGDVGTVPYTVPERAEVALLSRNIVVEGTPLTCPDPSSSPDDRYAGHVIFRKSAPTAANPIGHLSWVEFRNLGNEGVLGNYPVHFHKVGNLSSSFVDSCSIHHSFNRGLVVHDSQNLVVTDTVAFDTIGNTFYMEESAVPDPGLVTGCSWIGNLAFMTRGALAGNELTPEEVTPPAGSTNTGPACFWTENFDNVVLGNHAAGSEGMGFWIDLPSGQTFTAGFPGGMAGSVSHSSAVSGFYMDDFQTLALDPFTDPPVLEDLSAWKNRAYGVFARSFGTMVVDDLRVADNLGGVYLASAGNPKGISDGTIQHLTNSIVLGEPLQNLGAHLASDPLSEYTATERALVPPRSLPVDVPWCGGASIAPPLMPLTGVTIYDGLIAVEDTAFDFFRRFSYTTCGSALFRDAAAFTPVNYTSPWAVDPRGFGRNLTFGAQVERVAWMRNVYPDQDGIANSVLFDIEGDLLDSWRLLAAGLPLTCSNTGPTYLFPDNPFLLPLAGMTPACAEPNLNGHLWTPGAGECFATMDVRALGAGPYPSHLRYWRSDYTSSFGALPSADFNAIDAANSTVNYATNVALAAPVDALRNCLLLYWDLAGGTIPIPRQIHVSVHYARVGSALYFLVPYDFGLGIPTVSTNQSGSSPIQEVFNINDLLNASQDVWYRYMAQRPLGAGFTWQTPHTLIGKVVIDQDTPDAISQVVNDPSVADFYDGDVAHFYIQ